MNDLKPALPSQSICPFRIDCYPESPAAHFLSRHKR